MNADVLEEATRLWQQGIVHAGWHQVLVALLYLVLAWRCLSNAHMAKITQAPGAVWQTGAVLLLLLAANTLAHLDVWVGQVLRLTAHAQGWYGERRTLQYIVLALLLAALWGLGQRVYRRLQVDELPGLAATVGLVALLLLALLRAVSAHATDAVLNLRLAGLSMGRVLEFIGLGLVLWGTRGDWRVD
ncbi:MAG: hypothetical protein ACOYNF_08980 [Rhodoferax sp.]